MKKIAVLGSTGSIGRSTLALVDLHPEWFRPTVLAAGSNAELLYQQCVKYRPLTVAVEDERAAAKLRRDLPNVRVLGGSRGVVEAACCSDAEIVVSAITGAAGLLPTYEAAKAGQRIALANKETLVMAGDLFRPFLQQDPESLLPVDSEHSALHQCLRGERTAEVRRLILTASGGPFRGFSPAQLAGVTPDQALRHPTWQMGPKITVDSATLMNKGLEVIEAHYLFGIAGKQIDVVIHPQSVVHSLVEFVDGSNMAQLSHTDMKSAILYALTYPERRAALLPGLDLARISPLEFHEPDHSTFPSLQIAVAALEAGGTTPAALNAANEVAVDSFLAGRLSFPAIATVVQETLQAHTPSRIDSIETVLEADLQARRKAQELCDALVRQQ